MFSFLMEPSFDKEVDAYVKPRLFSNDSEEDSARNLVIKIGLSTKNVSICIQSIMKHISGNSPRCSMKALQLLNYLLFNSFVGETIRIQIQNDAFEKEFRAAIVKASPVASQVIGILLKKWSDEFSLTRLQQFYEILKSEGLIFTIGNFAVYIESLSALDKLGLLLIPRGLHTILGLNLNNDQLFNNNSQASTSTSSTRIGIGRPLPPSPMTQRERDDIAIAMELSLRETNSPNVPPLHQSKPKTNRSNPSAKTSKPKKELIVDCSICMEFKDNAEIVATECGHLYHKNCIYQWLQEANTCPECRLRTTQSSLRKLFVTSVARDVDQPNSSEIENLTKIAKKLNLTSKPNPHQSNTRTWEDVFLRSNNWMSEAAGHNRARPQRNRVNAQTSSATNFNRMIWLGANNKNLTKEFLSRLIFDQFNIAPNKFVIENLFLERNRAQMQHASFKISVDNEDIFNRLMNASAWRPYRVREFKDRSRNPTTRAVPRHSFAEISIDDSFDDFFDDSF